MIKKFSSSIAKIAGVFMIAAILLHPVKASAFGVADLLIATNDSEKLCDSGQYDWACPYAKQYRDELNTVLAISTDKARAKYIDDNVFRQLKTTAYIDIVSAYNNAVKDGKINPGADDAAGFNGDCNNGGVKISIGVNKNDECVGGNGVNPIYAYLKGIIVFMGAGIGLAVVVTIIVSGIQYSSSAGNPANITKAKERITNAVIGLVLYLFLAAILRYLVPQIFTS